ncbi:MAG: hypothetical protein K2Y20_12410 [Sphingomonas sp.]|nr:hypothetical protein [Sphingomonas sp.]
MPSSDVTEVVVSAKRSSNDFFIDIVNLFNGSTQDFAHYWAELTVDNDSGDASIQPDSGNTAPDVRTISNETPNPLNDAPSQRLKALALAIMTRLGNLPNAINVSIMSKDGKPVALDQIYSNLLNLDFLVTENSRFPKNYGGEIKKESTGWISTLLGTTLRGYDAWGEPGRAYLILQNLLILFLKPTHSMRRDFENICRIQIARTSSVSLRNSGRMRITSIIWPVPLAI